MECMRLHGEIFRQYGLFDDLRYYFIDLTAIDLELPVARSSRSLGRKALIATTQICEQPTTNDHYGALLGIKTAFPKRVIA